MCNDELWTARDAQSSEDEVGDFFYGLIRLIKPLTVIETGCYLGDTTIKIAKALRDNGVGEMITCDTGSDQYAYTRDRICKENLDDVCKVVFEKGVNIIKYGFKGKGIDFAFIDSGVNEVRTEEINGLLKVLNPNGMFAIHDTARHHQSNNQKLVKSIKLPNLYFNTPRGVSLFGNYEI